VTRSISVVIPAYQAARFIGEALESVSNQTIRVERIVVVDDGSTDDTAGAVIDWSRQSGVPVALIGKPNGGAGSARNVGRERTDSELLMFLDADDRLVKDALEHLCHALESQPSALIAYGAMETLVEEGGAGTIAHQRAVIATGPVMLLSSTLMRRRAFDEIGPFEDGNVSSMDWFAQIIERGAAASVSIDRVVAERRIHSANTSTNTKNLMSEYARMVKASLDRRRARGT